MTRRLHREQGRTEAVLKIVKTSSEAVSQAHAVVDAMAAKDLSPLHGAGSRHASQRRKIDSSFGPAVTQRQIRVDAIEKGEPFDTEVDYVQQHWGFTQAEGRTYKAWLKDGVDHHYASKATLVEAIKAATLPTTESFASMFGALANEEGLSTAWLEQILTAPEQSVETLKQETPEGLALMLASRSVNIDAAQLASLKLVELLDKMLKAGTITQSCGQTVMLLRQVIAPASSDTPPLHTDLGAVAAKIREANAKAATEREHYYVSVEGGGHAFVVEVWNDRCRVYQSFFNASTMASDMGRAQDFSINQFLQLLEVAFTANPEKGAIPRPVVQARLQLFASPAIHPDGGVRVSIFKQEQGAADRLQKRYMKDNQTWKPLLDTEASEHLKKSPPVSATPTGEKTIDYYSEGYSFYDSNYDTIGWKDMAANMQCILHFEGRVSLNIEVLENDPVAKRLRFRVNPET
jgi:hypothetical protein